MARNKSGSGNAVTLFPFLAVLVCVMGSLIFLLLATTKRMHEVAMRERLAALADDVDPPFTPEFAADDAPAIPLPVADVGAGVDELSDPVAREAQAAKEAQAARAAEEISQRLTDLQRRRDELQAELKRQRLLQKSAQKQVDAMQNSVGDAETKLRGTLAELTPSESNEKHTEEIASLEDRIIELRRRLRLLQNRPTEGETKYAVIPFDVRSGTTRRPILIECTESGLRFLPENVMVRPSDLEGFTERHNPLAAGAGALIAYWSEHNRQLPDAKQEPDPYVLLIVRPNGTVGYYVAMKMLAGLKQPFGYELLDDAVTLQVPPVDPEAQQVCRDAVAGLVSGQTPITDRQRGRDGFRRDRRATSDSFEVADVVPAEQPMNEGSWRDIERFEGRQPRGKPTPNASPDAARPPKSVAARPATTTTAAPQPVRSVSDAGKPRGVKPRELPEPSDDLPPPATEGRHGKSTAHNKIQLDQLSRRHWGESDQSATIGLEQDVTIRVDSRRVIVAEDRVIHQQPGEASLDMFLRVMEAVDTESRTWGKPRPGFYWTPRLRFVISPGGNQVFERIDPFAIRSGLATTRDFTLESATLSVPEELP